MDIDTPIVELIDITLTSDAGWGVFNGLNLAVNSGETAIIIGPTGSGKTSLAELLNGVRRPDSGTVLMFGKPVNVRRKSRLATMRRKIGGVGGQYRLISHQTVYENLQAPLIIRGETASRRKQKINQTLDDFNLGAKRRDRARTLSRGEQIIAMLARAVVATPPLLLIDEPLAGLDLETAGKVLDSLKRLAVAGYTMIILTTGRTGLEIPEAKEYYILDGVLQ